MTVFSLNVENEIAARIVRKEKEVLGRLSRAGCHVQNATFLEAILPEGAQAVLEYAWAYHHAGRVNTASSHDGTLDDGLGNRIDFALIHPIILRRESWNGDAKYTFEGRPQARALCADAYEVLFAPARLWASAVCAFRVMNHALNDGGALAKYLPWLRTLLAGQDKPDFTDTYNIDRILPGLRNNHHKFRSVKYNEARWDELVGGVTPKSYVALAREQVAYLALGADALSQAHMMEASTDHVESGRDGHCYFESVRISDASLNQNNPFVDDDRFSEYVSYV